MSLGSITVRLTMDTATFDTDAGRAAKIAEKRAKEIDASFKKAGAAIGVALAGAAVALTKLAKNAIDNADAIRDMSNQYGVSTETLSAFGYAASQTGTDMETVGKGIKALSKNMVDSLDPASESAAIFKELGLEVLDASDKMKDAGAFIPELADKISGLGDGTTKTALLLKLLGKSGVEMTEFLNSGSQGLAEFTDRARELGVVIDQDTANAADELNDRLGDLKQIASGLGLAIAQELLPDLNRLVGKFTDGADAGDRMKETATKLADGLRVLATAAGYIAKAFEIAGVGIATVMAQANAAYLFLTGNFSEAATLYKTASAGFDQAISGAPAPAAKRQTVVFAGDGAEPSGMFKMSAGELAARQQGAELEKALQAALGNRNPTGGTAKPKGGSSGKSEAAKEADQLTQSYERMVAQLTEQAAMVGVVSEVEKLRYELNNGEMAKLSEGQKNELLNLAQIAEFRKEDYEELQKAIKADEDRQRAVDDATKAYEEVNLSITDQIKLLGMSADEQELWNALAWAGVEADSERGKVIAANMGKLQAQREEMSDHIELMDSIRDAGEGFFTDFVGGSKSFKDAMLDAFNSVHEKILSMIAENLMDQLFGKKGDPLGGVFGGMFGAGSGEGGGFDISSLFGSFFGGGKASGGMARPNTLYEVNERGFEMATVGGRDYMMTGNSPVQITPNHALRGGGPLVGAVNFNGYGRPDRRTAQQAASDVATVANRALARNGRGGR